MKKKISSILAAVLLLTLLGSCGASSTSGRGTAAPMDGAYNSDWDYSVNQSTGGMMEEYGLAPGEMAEVPKGESSADAISGYSDKIIYTADADIETTEFDESLKMVDRLLSDYGAFIQSSSITGVDYYSQRYGYSEGRRADITIRVPSEKYNALTSSLSGLGNVLYLYSNAENVSVQYYDTESRLKIYRVEEERLLSMLEKAENVEDMISVEERLSEVRYKIESLTTTLLNLQNRIDYCTVSLSIVEVIELTENEPLKMSYAQEVLSTFKSSLKGVGVFFSDFFIIFVAFLPALVVLLVIGLIIRSILVARRRKRAGEAPRPSRRELRREKKRAKLAERDARGTDKGPDNEPKD